MAKTIGEVDPAEVIGAVFGRDRLGVMSREVVPFDIGEPV
jgi:hypothetical protein